MQLDEALRILGLTDGSTVEEIDRAYRDVMRREHPDIGGSQEQAVQINLARDTARKAAQKSADRAKYAAEHEAVQPAKHKKVLMPEFTMSPHGQETREILTEMLQTRVRPYRLASILCAALCLVLAAVAIVTSPGVDFDKALHHSLMWTLLFGLPALICAYYCSAMIGEVQRVGRQVSELSELLQNPAGIKILIDDLLPQLKDQPAVGRKKLEEDVDRTMRSSLRTLQFDYERAGNQRLTRAQIRALAYAVSESEPKWQTLLAGVIDQSNKKARGLHDFGRVFVAKGLEDGFVEERQSMLRGALWIGYKVTDVALERATTIAL
jgi:hypothetical protein